MIFFNYEKLFLASRGDSKTIVKHFINKSTTGINWIINETPIVTGMFDDRVLAEYIGLCSLRNFSDFALFKNKDLDIFMIPDWIPDQVISENPLVKIENTKLIFLFEEEPICQQIS